MLPPAAPREELEDLVLSAECAPCRILRFAAAVAAASSLLLTLPMSSSSILIDRFRNRRASFVVDAAAEANDDEAPSERLKLTLPSPLIPPPTPPPPPPPPTTIREGSSDGVSSLGRAAALPLVFGNGNVRDFISSDWDRERGTLLFEFVLRGARFRSVPHS